MVSDRFHLRVDEGWATLNQLSTLSEKYVCSEGDSDIYLTSEMIIFSFYDAIYIYVSI